MNGKTLLCFGICAVTLLGVASDAPASVFFGVNTSGALTRFDMDAQTVTVVSNVHVGAGPTIPNLQDIEFDAAGNLYVIRAQSTGFPPTVFNEIYRITDPATGSALLTGSISSGGLPHTSLGFRPSSGSFYSVNNINGHLGTLDVNSGAFASVAGVPNGIRNTVPALAVNPVSGLAYGIIDAGSPPPFGTSNYSLIAMNLDTGLSTVIGSLIGAQTATAFTALRFDDAGIAYTVGMNTGNVYSVNVSTGAATLLFNGGSAAVNTTGLAFIVPGPGGAGLLLGVALLGVRRRR
jgi:hypothetical protein